jgi:hypothetical protein
MTELLKREPLTLPPVYGELNAIARRAFRLSPQSEFIQKWMAKAEAEKASFITADKVDAMLREPAKPLLAHVAPNGNFNVHVVSDSGGGATEVATIEVGNITAITVTGSGSFTDHVLSREEPDILSITRDVARSG